MQNRTKNGKSKLYCSPGTGQTDPSNPNVQSVISRRLYVEWFLSDRRHMKTDDGWSAQPPDWPLVSDTTSNLHHFTNMTDLKFGVVSSTAEMLANYV